MDLQVLVVILCIRTTGWLQGGVLQAEAREVWRPPVRTKGGTLQPSPEWFLDKLPASALAWQIVVIPWMLGQ